MDVNNLLKLMVQRDISDIHFKADSVPVLRRHGKLIAAKSKALPADQVREMAYHFMSESQKKVFEGGEEMDLAYTLDGVSRFRVNVYQQRGTVALTLRVVPLQVGTFEGLNLPPEALKKLTQETRGLVLFAGITGAGKTTSMNSFIRHLNETRTYRIVTIEDPIEFFHQDRQSSVIQREVGSDTKSFAKALRLVLRQDPDVVVVGEMRDLETIAAGVTAAETGHLVLSTIHTIDAVQTVDRLVDVFPESQQKQIRQQIANVLKGVMAQRLVSSADGQSRYPATEVLVVTSLVRRLIAEGKTSELYKTMEQGGYYGMHTFDQDLLRYIKEEKITQEDALENATNPENLSLQLKGII
ncbi:MAG: PilT/PilU family type 4a pilus ATPase [Elusimicrobia bacterium]|nr:PilT/PilU family type 4a pilus ATPase [Elusimicrobiota bacterium]